MKRNAITFEVLISLLKFTMEEAAIKLGTSVSMLKRACRDHGKSASYDMESPSFLTNSILRNTTLASRASDVPKSQD